MPRKFSDPVYLHDRPWWLYDLLIFVALAVFASAHLWFQHRHPILGLLALVGFLTIVYGAFIEPHLLTVRRYEVGKGERRVRLAFISDVHVGPYKGARWVRRLVERTHALAPDAILLGGDLLYEKASDLPKLEPFKGLKAPLGVYAILGNHDEWKASREAHAWLAASGLTGLENRSARVLKDGAGVSFAGAEDDWYEETDLDAAFRGVPPDDLLVAMLHNPDLAPPAAKMLKDRPGPTVFFSGHAHGGQIRLPFLGPVPTLPHHLGRKFDRGVFSFDGIPLVLGAGAGESGPRARLFCPPEIVLVEVRW